MWCLVLLLLWLVGSKDQSHCRHTIPQIIEVSLAGRPMGIARVAIAVTGQTRVNQGRH